MNCYIPSGHLLRPPKATGVGKLRPLHKELGSGLNGGITMATTTGPPSNYNGIRAGLVELLEADRGCRSPECQFDCDPLCTGTVNCVYKVGKAEWIDTYTRGW